MSLFDRFKKPSRKEISNDEKKRFLKEAYKLGYEVGYHQHSELGWVAEKYSSYVKKASEYGFKDEIEKIYIEGKQVGRRERFKSLYIDQFSIAEKAEKKRLLMEDKFTQLNQPLMLDISSNILRIRMISLPSILKGFRLFKR